jgi:hypothetical protein
MVQVCGQQEFWGLFAKCQFPGAKGAAAVTEEQSLWVAGACLPVQASKSTVQLLLAVWGNQACWPAPSVTHGAVEALGPTYTEAQVSLAFQGEGRRLCSCREHGALSSCVCVRKQTYHPASTE